MHTAATHIVRITTDHFTLFGHVALELSKGLGVTLTATPGQLEVVVIPPLIMEEICRLEVRTLLQQNDGIASNRKLLGHNTACCTGSHNHKINFVSGRKTGKNSFSHSYSPRSA